MKTTARKMSIFVFMAIATTTTLALGTSTAMAAKTHTHVTQLKNSGDDWLMPEIIHFACHLLYIC